MAYFELYLYMLQVAFGDDSVYRCYFYNRLDGDDLEVGKDCEKIN